MQQQAQHTPTHTINHVHTTPHSPPRTLTTLPHTPPHSPATKQTLPTQGTGLASLNLPHLMDTMRSLSLALQALGAPAREGPAKLAHANLQQEINAVVASGDAAGFAKVVARALALMRVQGRMLRLDLANVRLGALAATLKNGSGTR